MKDRWMERELSTKSELAELASQRSLTSTFALRRCRHALRGGPLIVSRNLHVGFDSAGRHTSN